MNPLVGYFSDPTQTEPEHDPTHDGPCLVCRRQLTPEDVRTVSLTPIGGTRSLFFRVHRTCAEADPKAVEAIEHSLIGKEAA